MPTDTQIQELIDAQFSHLDPSFAHLNNGSFGCAPKEVLEGVEKQSKKWLSCSDHFYFNEECRKMFQSSINALGPLVNCPEPYEDHLTLVDNATTAAAIVAKALLWKRLKGEYHAGDTVVMFDAAYGAVKMSFEHYLAPVGVTITQVPTPFPLNHLSVDEANDTILQQFIKTVESVRTPIRLVVLEHIGSEYAFLFPLANIVRYCRSNDNVGLIYADAAHALGNVDVNLQLLDCDFYVTNCHKWFFCPQPCAMFYSKNSFNQTQDTFQLHHPIVSWNLGQGFFMESVWVGTRDNAVKSAPSMVIPVLPKMAAKLGLYIDPPQSPAEALKSIQEYNRSMVVEYAHLLSEAWSTYIATPDDLITSTALVALPEAIGLDRDGLRLTLLNRFKISCVCCVLQCYISSADNRKKPRAFARISHQVYVKQEDVFRLKDAILTLVAEAQTF